MGQLVDLSQGCRVLAYPAEKPYAFIRPVDGTRVFVAFHAVEPAVDEVLVQGWPAAGGIQYTAVPGSWPDCEVPDEALAGAMLNPKVVREQGPSGAICPVPGSVVSPDDGTGHLTLIPIEPQGLCDSLCSAGGDLQAGDQVLVCTAVEGRKCLGLKRVCDQRAGPALVTRCVASGGDGKPYDGIQVDGSLMTGPGARRIEYLPLADAVFPLADAPWMLHGDGDFGVITDPALVETGGYVRVGMEDACGWQYAVQAVDKCHCCCEPTLWSAPGAHFSGGICFHGYGPNTGAGVILQGRDNQVIYGDAPPADRPLGYHQITVRNPYRCPAKLTAKMHIRNNAASSVPTGTTVKFVHTLGETLAIPFGDPGGGGSSPIQPNWSWEEVEIGERDLQSAGPWSGYSQQTGSLFYERMMQPGETVILYGQWWIVFYVGGTYTLHPMMHTSYEIDPNVVQVAPDDALVRV